MRDIMEKLRSKYKGAESEINDLTKALTIVNKLLFLDQKNLDGLRQRHYINKLLLNFVKSEEDILNAIKIDKLNYLSNKMIVEFNDADECEILLWNDDKLVARLYTGDESVCKFYLIKNSSR